MIDIIGAVTGLFVVVYEGQHALKFTLGHAKEVVGPGVNFKIPIIQKFEVRDTKHTTLDLEPQVIQLADDLVYEVDCKVLYKIVDLRKAIVEIDDLVTGLKNRVVMAVQHVVGRHDRRSVRDTEAMVRGIAEELAPVEEQWGVRILRLGFSNISPSPTTLEITQLELLAREKHTQYQRFRAAGLSEEASVALVSGAVVAVHPEGSAPSRAAERREDLALREALRPAEEPVAGAEPAEPEDEPESGADEPQG
jgi:regulator of protease activity HflC (stomatin/prohibitin superfamily)